MSMGFTFAAAALLAAGPAPVVEKTVGPVIVRHAGAPERPAVFDVGDTIEVVVSAKGAPRGAKVAVRWIDSYERHVAEEVGTVGEGGTATLRFRVQACVSTGNRMEVLVDGKPLGEPAPFGCVPQHTRPLRDWYVFPWAQYPIGTGDTLRGVGVNGGMAYRLHPFDKLIANDLRFYVDNMAHPIFAFYLKNRRVFRDQVNAYQQQWKEKGVANKALLVRQPCLSDPETMKRMREMLQEQVRFHAPYKPVWYNMQDEGGLAYMGRRNEFCYGPHCLAGLRTWLKERYGSLAALNESWRTDFKAWDDVVPMTSHEIRRREKDVPLTERRLGPWCDHRAYMDIVMTRALKRAREFCREADPDGLFGMTGSVQANPWDGFDFSLIPTAVDIAHYYDYANAIEIARSLHPRHNSRLFPYPGWSTGKDRTRRDWYYLFHGLSVTGHWDKEMELLDAKGRPTEKVLAFKDTWLELQRGIGRLFINAKRDNDPIAIHFSQPSLRVWTLTHEDPAFKDVAFWWDTTGAIRALEDLGFQYEFVASNEVEEGILEKGGFRALFLLNAIALSKRENAAIDKWVRAGGVLVTDRRSGLFDEHGRGQANVLVPPAPGVTVVERGRGQVAEVSPAFLKDYAADRITGGDSAAIVKGAIRVLLRLAGLEARLPVLDEEGEPLPGTETVLFTDGRARYAAIFRNPGYDRRLNKRVGEREYRYAFGEPAKVTVRFDGSGVAQAPSPAVARQPGAAAPHPEWVVYNVRAGKYLGNVKTATATLEPWEPLCFALLPYRVTGLTIDVPRMTGAGSSVPVRLGVKAAGRPAGAAFVRHVLRVDVFAPDGSLRAHYSRNLETDNGGATMAIPLALNDPLGTWRLRVRDIATGVTTEQTFDVNPRREGR